MFSRHLVIYAVNNDAISMTFELYANGKRLFVIVEDIPVNYPPRTCWVFTDIRKLEQILETLKIGGWEIIENDYALNRNSKCPNCKAKLIDEEISESGTSEVYYHCACCGTWYNDRGEVNKEE